VCGWCFMSSTRPSSRAHQRLVEAAEQEQPEQEKDGVVQASSIGRRWLVGGDEHHHHQAVLWEPSVQLRQRAALPALCRSTPARRWSRYACCSLNCPALSASVKILEAEKSLPRHQPGCPHTIVKNAFGIIRLSTVSLHLISRFSITKALLLLKNSVIRELSRLHWCSFEAAAAESLALFVFQDFF